jgi:glycosyltransferase involved in cell wall biosynthesis
MNTLGKVYLMVLPVNYYRIDGQHVALEGAFVEHLRQLKQKTSVDFARFVVALVEMTQGDYERSKQGLTILNEAKEGLFFETVRRKTEGELRLALLPQLLKVSRRMRRLVKQCDLLHSGLSSNVWFPFEFIAIIQAILLKKPTIFVVDIDYRNSAQMNRRTGKFSLKSYLLSKLVYDKLRSLQIQVAAAKCSLLLLKGKKLREDFGSGKPHVKNFLNASHSQSYIVDPGSLESKIANLRDRSLPLEIVYFGRLVKYKGIDHCIRAVAHAQQMCDRKIRFHIIGGGNETEALQQLAVQLGMENNIIFHGSLPFNLELFKQLHSYHLLLAAPLSEDTPRSALDAMAAGIPILAFDTYYYTDLVPTGAVEVVPWLSIEKMAQRIADYGHDETLLAEMIVRAIDFARENTQESG